MYQRIKPSESDDDPHLHHLISPEVKRTTVLHSSINKRTSLKKGGSKYNKYNI